MYINLRKSLRTNVTYFSNNCYGIKVHPKDAKLFLNFLKVQKELLEFITKFTDGSRSQEYNNKQDSLIEYFQSICRSSNDFGYYSFEEVDNSLQQSLETEIDKIKIKLSKKEAESLEANEKNKILKDKIKQLECKIQDQNLEVKDQVQNYKIKFVEANEKNKVLKDKIKQLECKIEKQNLEVKDQIQDYKIKLVKANEKNNVLKDKINELERKIQDQNLEVKDQVQNYKIKFVEANEKNNVLKDKINELMKSENDCKKVVEVQNSQRVKSLIELFENLNQN